MESNEKEKLVEELMTVEAMIRENPCQMPDGVMTALRQVMHSFFGKFCVEGASRDQVAKYLGRDIRTLTRWMDKYEDFPKPKRSGHKELTFDWMEVVRWKIKHEDALKQ